jgi:hypothetical protein
MPAPLARCAFSRSAPGISTVILRAVSMVLCIIPYSIPVFDMVFRLGRANAVASVIDKLRRGDQCGLRELSSRSLESRRSHDSLRCARDRACPVPLSEPCQGCAGLPA